MILYIEKVLIDNKVSVYKVGKTSDLAKRKILTEFKSSYKDKYGSNVAKNMPSLSQKSISISADDGVINEIERFIHDKLLEKETKYFHSKKEYYTVTEECAVKVNSIIKVLEKYDRISRNIRSALAEVKGLKNYEKTDTYELLMDNQRHLGETIKKELRSLHEEVPSLGAGPLEKDLCQNIKKDFKLYINPNNDGISYLTHNDYHKSMEDGFKSSNKAKEPKFQFSKLFTDQYPYSQHRISFEKAKKLMA